MKLLPQYFLVLALAMTFSFVPQASGKPESCLGPTVAASLMFDVERLREAFALTGEAKKAALLEYSKPKPKPLWLKSTVVINWALTSMIVYTIGKSVISDPGLLVQVAPHIVTAMVAADFALHVGHKALDSYVRETNRIFGNTARDFRHHHEVSSNLNGETYVDNVAWFSLYTMPFFAGTLLAQLNPAVRDFVHMNPVAGTAAVVFLLSLMNSPEVHRQAHLEVPTNRFIAGGQYLSVFIDRILHGKHHTIPNDEEFGVFLKHGVAEVARATDAWRKMDLLWWKWRGLVPNNWYQNPQSIPVSVLEEMVADIDKIPNEIWVYGAAYPRRIDQVPALKR